MMDEMRQILNELFPSLKGEIGIKNLFLNYDDIDQLKTTGKVNFSVRGHEFSLEFKIN